MPPKSSTMIGLAAGAAVLLMGALMGFYGKVARMKKQIEELVVASKHITTEHDAALLSMKMQALNLQLLAEIHTELRAQNDREAELGKACERSIEQTGKDGAEVIGLLRQLVTHLVPTPDADTWEDALRKRFTSAEYDVVYERCADIVKSALVGGEDPYPRIGRELLGAEYVPEDRSRVKAWFFAEQLRRMQTEE